MKNMFNLILLSVLAIGCDDASWSTGPSSADDWNANALEQEYTPVVDVYCDNCTTDENGNLYYEYTGHNYGTINFSVTDVEYYPTVIGWTSPHLYCVDHWGQEICEPVINYQTYSDENGNGQQNFYMNETFIGDTLKIIGYINSESYDIIDLIIIDGR